MQNRKTYQIFDDSIGLIRKEREALLFFYIITTAIQDAINPLVSYYEKKHRRRYWNQLRDDSFEWIMSDETDGEYPTFLDMLDLVFVEPIFAIEKIRSNVTKNRELYPEMPESNKRGVRVFTLRYTPSNTSSKKIKKKFTKRWNDHN